MACVADGCSQHLRLESVCTVDVHDLGDESHTVFADVVQTSDKRRDIRCSGLGSKESLSGGEHQRAVGAYAFLCKVFDSLDAVGNARNLHHDVGIESGQLFAFLDHALIVCGNHFGAHVTVDDVADVNVVLTLIFYTLDAFLGHQRGVSCHTVEHAHSVGFADLVQISCVNKEFHT